MIGLQYFVLLNLLNIEEITYWGIIKVRKCIGNHLSLHTVNVDIWFKFIFHACEVCINKGKSIVVDNEGKLRGGGGEWRDKQRNLET
jgi:hypothetical protein